ncbi:MAG TPA: hypothetical protein VLE02_01795 [Nitrosarchaeum sp.]|nr:hypothetical protein [Nitrosarchaeum sp.]
MAYQNLTKFNGSMYGEASYGGLEFDWEVPDNLTIGSPGGVSSQHHHYTKGFYGKGNSSSDIYGGQGERYISGEYGNLYQEGQSANQGMGYYGDAPDYPFYNKEVDVQKNAEDIEFVDEPKSSKKNPSRENYTPLVSDVPTTSIYIKIAGFILLALTFMCFCFYFITFHKFLEKQHQNISLSSYLGYSALFTSVVIILGYAIHSNY